jgi:hypothetical protein
MATFNRKNVLKSGAGVYSIAGVMGTITIGKQLLADGASFPDTLTVDGLSVKSPKEAPKKMTKEERAAANAAKTPQQRLEEQAARLAKQQANLEARKAKLAQANA